MALLSAENLVWLIIMLFSQKKRLAKKASIPKKEKTLLFIRLILLIPMLCLSIALPYIFGAIMGYPGLGYYAVWAWGGQSAIVLCLILDMLIISLLIISIARYIRRKNVTNKI